MAEMEEMALFYANEYGISRREGKSEKTFFLRVATRLREDGKIIEAHEIVADARYETSDQVMDGVMGACAKALQGRDYSGDPVGSDIAAGICFKNPGLEIGISPQMASLIVELFGKEGK